LADGGVAADTAEGEETWGSLADVSVGVRRGDGVSGDR
jgi:hypothetical protein